MNSAHLHLILNHAPIFTTIFALGLIAISLVVRGTTEHTSRGTRLLGSTTAASRGMLLKLGLWMLVVGGAIAVPAYLTGEPAEEAVEHLAGVSERMIGAHESAAQWALIFAIGAGILSLVALLRMRSGMLSRPAVLFMLTISLISSVSFSYTAYQGGQIRHTEISSGTATASPNAEPAQGEKDEDD